MKILSVVPHAAEQEAKPNDPVADNHDRRKNRISSEFCGVRSARHHYGND
jgi:hypothetical protein